MAKFWRVVVVAVVAGVTICSLAIAIGWLVNTYVCAGCVRRFFDADSCIDADGRWDDAQARCVHARERCLEVSLVWNDGQCIEPCDAGSCGPRACVLIDGVARCKRVCGLEDSLLPAFFFDSPCSPVHDLDDGGTALVHLAPKN